MPRRAGADPNFAANVGKAIDTLRDDHAMLPEAVPGISVAEPTIALDIAQLPALAFQGEAQYREFWQNFRTGVQLISPTARSEVVNVVHSGVYLRVRWRLLLAGGPQVGGADVAAAAVGAARGALDQGKQNPLLGALDGALGGGLSSAGKDLLGEAERWVGANQQSQQERPLPDGWRSYVDGSTGSPYYHNAATGETQWEWPRSASPQEERVVELNSVYELDCWTGRLVRHTLEFRSPDENFDILGAMQGVPTPSFR